MKRLSRFLRCGLLAAAVLAPVVRAPIAWGQETSASDKWKQLSPEERARVMQNYQEWRRLSPEVRGQLQAKYKEFAALPPETRLRLRKLWQRIQSLPADKRERLLKLDREKWGRLTPEERAQILNDLRPEGRDDARSRSGRGVSSHGSKR